MVSDLPPPVNAMVWAVDSFFVDDLPPHDLAQANCTPEVPPTITPVAPRDRTVQP